MSTKKVISLANNVNSLHNHFTHFLLYRSCDNRYVEICSSSKPVNFDFIEEVKNNNSQVSKKTIYKWLSHTKLRCKHCVHSFDSIPVPIPAKYFKNQQKFLVYGLFCSFSCALQFLMERNFPDKDYQISLLFTMAKMIFDILPEDIVPAPPQDRLDIFGGPYSIEHFRSLSNSEVFVRELKREVPFLPMTIGIEKQFEILNIQNHQTTGTTNSILFNPKDLTNEKEQNDEEFTSENAYITASGKVPIGGLFGQFLNEKKINSSSLETQQNVTSNLNVDKTTKRKQNLLNEKVPKKRKN